MDNNIFIFHLERKLNFDNISAKKKEKKGMVIKVKY